jgi:hypothetical protein
MKHDLKPVRVYHVNDGGGRFDQMDEYAEPNRIGADYYYRDEVDALLAGINSAWIKCGERMPPDGVPVLVWCPSGPKFGMEWGAHVAQIDGAFGFCGDVEWAHLDLTTHWQALPEPPND